MAWNGSVPIASIRSVCNFSGLIVNSFLMIATFLNCTLVMRSWDWEGVTITDNLPEKCADLKSCKSKV